MYIIDKRNSKAHNKLINKLNSINEMTPMNEMSFLNPRQPACKIRPSPLASLEQVDSVNTFNYHADSPRPLSGALLVLEEQQKATKRFHYLAPECFDQKVSQNALFISPMLGGHESVNYMKLETCQNRQDTALLTSSAQVDD